MKDHNNKKNPKTAEGRKQKKEHMELDKFIVDDDASDEEYRGGEQSDDEEATKIKKGAKKGNKAHKLQKEKELKWEKAFDSNEEEGETQSSKENKRGKKKVPAQEQENKPKKQRKARDVQNPNMIKTQNKLIGAIQNSGLYDEDDEMGNPDQTSYDQKELLN